MPLLNTVTTPYAEAFLQVADASGETDVVVGQARSLLEIWSSSPELREALGSPILEVDAKKALLAKLFAEQVSPIFLNLLKLLADRKRIGILGPVLERLLEIYRDQNNIALATITSAQPLRTANRR